MGSSQESVAFVSTQQTVSDGIAVAERYANTAKNPDVEGTHDIETLVICGMRRNQMRRQFGLPTGHILVQQEVQLY